MSASILALIRQAENPCARAAGDVESVEDIPVRGARLRANLDWRTGHKRDRHTHAIPGRPRVMKLHVLENELLREEDEDDDEREHHVQHWRNVHFPVHGRYDRIPELGRPEGHMTIS